MEKKSSKWMGRLGMKHGIVEIEAKRECRTKRETDEKRPGGKEEQNDEKRGKH